MAGVRKPKVDQEVPHFLSVAEMQRFRDALLTSLLPVRNLAVGLVFLDCGARRGEVASAAVADLDITTGVLTIRRGKGGKGRRVPLTSTTIYALRCWLAVRPASLGRSLFGMTGIAIYRMVRSAAHRAGVEVSVHGLRHTFATYYDGPLDDLQKILGHANVETTITIYRHRLDEELIRDHAQRSPLAQLARGRQLGLDLDRKG
ncbi:MAG: tyrosine-type recombinase/integrase [Anaerolineales bacterium]|nr:tyrosine-type recombinase/integrase [Anaerolineales bacterium]